MSNISWWWTTFGENEIERIAEAIGAGRVSQGPVTAEFERRLSAILDVPYVVATTNGSTALVMALLACGIGPGDEVIVPNRTWIATAHAVVLLGAKPIFVDCQRDLPIVDAEAIEPLITSRTRAIIPVHLNGRSADMNAIHNIARKHGLRVVEDAAQALCSRNEAGFLGTQSDVGCFSLSVTKIITTGQGGFVVTREEGLAKRLVSIRTHGIADVIDPTYTEFGFNFRFTDVLASFGLAQLERLQLRIEHAKAIYRLYDEALADLSSFTMIPVDIAAGEIPVYVEVLCEDRKGLVEYLRDRNIQARPFSPDLNVAPYMSTSRAFPNSARFGEHGVCLPSGGEQPLDNVRRVIQALHDFSKRA